jgi:hypothetical protein
MAGTALPAETGNSVIGDHCDMQLAFLRELTIGTEILVETPSCATPSSWTGAMSGC